MCSLSNGMLIWSQKVVAILSRLQALGLRKFVTKRDGESTGLNSNSRPSEHKHTS
jgi:hypothetical protein